MVDIIKINDGIDDSISYLEYIIDRIDEANLKLDKIDEKLLDDNWTGEAKNQCVHINNGIRTYCDVIDVLARKLKKDIKTLKEDAEDFKDNSSNIELIKSI